MEALKSILVRAPFAINDVMAIVRRHVTVGFKLGRVLDRNNIGIGIGTGITVVDDAKGIVLEIIPGQGRVGVKDKVRLGDPIAKLFRVYPESLQESSMRNSS